MKQFFRTHWIMVSIVAVFAALQVIVMHAHSIPYWDAAVYVGSGKYLFSHGTVGTWETLRPVALPIILGACWKIGLNPYLAGTVFGLISSCALLVLVYSIAESARKGAGVIAALLLGASTTYFTYAAVPVTDITSVFFSLLAVWLAYKAQTNRQYLVAGFVASVACMFRFPHGLTIVVLGLIVIAKLFQEHRGKKWNDDVARMIERLFAVAGGFCILMVPFLVSNYYFYHNAFKPFIEGTASITGYPSLYQKGVWFYAIGLVREDFLVLFSVVPIVMLYRKAYRSKIVIALTMAVVVIGGYFIVYQTHKELRFALAFLPFLMILASIGIMYVLEWTKQPRMLFIGLFLIVAFMASVGSFVYLSESPNDQAFYDFDTYFKNTPKAHVMTTTPFIFAYSDILLTHNLYGNWNDAYYDYHTFGAANDYIALDSCSLELGCADNAQCRDKKEALLTELAAHDTKVFDETTPETQCHLVIYKMGK